uniref:G_PROTEIN_RECEP_F1_2 domain-containing protein n=1 Tax=Steinernema glaseri TaxID=37863 RepID=A0A1I8A6A6_9BILA
MGKGQIRLKQGLIMFFALPGVFLPMLTIYAYKIRRPRHFLWWICWMSAHNLHTVITAIVDFLKIFVLEPNNPYVFFQRGREAVMEPTLYFTARELLGLTKLLTVPFSFYIVYVVFMFYCDCLLYAWNKHFPNTDETQTEETNSLSLPEVDSRGSVPSDGSPPKEEWRPVRCFVCSQRMTSQQAVLSLRKWRSYGSSSVHSHSIQASDETEYSSIVS